MPVVTHAGRVRSSSVRAGCVEVLRCSYNVSTIWTKLCILSPKAMENSSKKILIVCDDECLRSSRALVLESAGYNVKTVSSDDGAMKVLETETFDLVLIGRNLANVEKQLDQRLREKYADLKTLKIQIGGEVFSIYPSRTVDSLPIHVLAALAEMLGG